MRYLAATAMAISLAVSGVAMAQGADPLDHYDAYLAAVEAGDYTTAGREGEAAWRAAEAEWGEDGDTGLLAFTIAQYRVSIGDLAGALEPAERAVALAPLSTEYSVDEARVLAGAAAAISDPAAGRQNLEQGLAALDASGVGPREDLIRARLTLASLQLDGDAETAVATGQKAVDDSRAANSPNLRTHLYELGRVQYLAGQFFLASGTLAESLNMWEEQRPGELPPALASTLAWQAIASAANARSAPEGDAAPARRPGFGFDFGPVAPPHVWNFHPRRSNCSIEWEQTEPATFPMVDNDTATLGAAVVIYDLDESGAATNVRIAGSAPGAAQHQDFILEQVGQRKARRFVREPCRAGQISVLHYDF